MLGCGGPTSYHSHSHRVPHICIHTEGTLFTCYLLQPTLPENTEQGSICPCAPTSRSDLKLTFPLQGAQALGISCREALQVMCPVMSSAPGRLVQRWLRLHRGVSCAVGRRCMEDGVLQQCPMVGCSCDEGRVQDACRRSICGRPLWIAPMAMVCCIIRPVLAGEQCFGTGHCQTCRCLTLQWLHAKDCCVWPAVLICHTLCRCRRFLPGFWFGSFSAGVVLIGGRLLAGSVELWVLFQHLRTTVKQDVQV